MKALKAKFFIILFPVVIINQSSAASFKICKPDYEYKCGDVCVEESKSCHCGNVTVSDHSPNYCCLPPGDKCNYDESSGHAVCRNGTAVSRSKPCNGACHIHTSSVDIFGVEIENIPSNHTDAAGNVICEYKNECSSFHYMCGDICTHRNSR